MAGKGSGRRLTQIHRIENDLRFELKSDKTPQGRKDEISALLEVQSSLLKMKADINCTPERKAILQKTLDGELPYLRTPDGIDLYFPWSEHYGN